MTNAAAKRKERMDLGLRGEFIGRREVDVFSTAKREVCQRVAGG